MFPVILPLALGSAISPTLFAAVIIMLSSQTKPYVRGLCYLIGAILPLLLVSILISVFSHSLTSFGFHVKAYSTWIDMGISMLLFLFGLRLVLLPTKPKKTSVPSNSSSLLVKSFLLGFFMMLTDFTTFALFIPAVKDIFFSDHLFSTQLMSLGLLFSITLIPIEIPLLFFAYNRKLAARVLTPVSTFMTKYGKRIAIWLCFISSGYLLVKALLQLHF